MAVDDRIIDSAGDLISKWGQLEATALICAVVLGIAIISTIVIYMIFQYKKEKMIQDGKFKRSKEYSSNVSRIENKIDIVSKNIIDMIQNVLQSNNSALNDVKTNLNLIRNSLDGLENFDSDMKLLLNKCIEQSDIVLKTVNDILVKTRGILSIKDSYYIIRLYFYKVIFFEIEKLIHEMIEEDEYKTRRDFVTNKIRTDIGVILASYKVALCEFDMEINTNKFFKVDSNEPKERFMLVDLLWSELKMIFPTDKSIKQKKEEASLKINNVITDYISEIAMNENIGG
jgi:hypothetical protein